MINMLKNLEFAAIDLPEFKEVRGKEWVSMGLNNLFPQVLIDLYQSSSIHHTCLNAKTDATVGQGFKYFGDEVINTEGKTLNDLLEQVALDYMVFGTFALNIIWNREGTRIAEIYHLLL